MVRVPFSVQFSVFVFFMWNFFMPISYFWHEIPLVRDPVFYNICPVPGFCTSAGHIRKIPMQVHFYRHTGSYSWSSPVIMNVSKNFLCRQISIDMLVHLPTIFFCWSGIRFSVRFRYYFYLFKSITYVYNYFVGSWTERDILVYADKLKKIVIFIQNLLGKTRLLYMINNNIVRNICCHKIYVVQFCHNVRSWVYQCKWIQDLNVRLCPQYRKL